MKEEEVASLPGKNSSMSAVVSVEDGTHARWA